MQTSSDAHQPSSPHERIKNFLRQHTILILATSLHNIPWCATCFYAYAEEQNILVFKSDSSTRHIPEALTNPVVAGAINHSTTKVGNIQGIQFTGRFDALRAQKDKLKNIYLKKFPMATVVPGELWGIKLDYIKMTDNTLGFGKKIIWEKK